MKHEDNKTLSPPSVDRTWITIATAVVALVLIYWGIHSAVHSSSHVEVGADVGVVPAHTLAAVVADGGRLYPTLMERPAVPRVLVGGLRDGKQASVSCTTCHATRSPDPLHGAGKPLDEFHTDLVFAHGGGALSCLSCHNGDDYDALRGADGRNIPYGDVMELCAQCHSTQHNDYLHGAHGGMTGHWDLSRGSRTRNNCVDCHDPHAPAFPSMQPTFKPKDRGLEAPSDGDH